MIELETHLPEKLENGVKTAVVATGKLSAEQMAVYSKVASRHRGQHAFFLAQAAHTFEGFKYIIS